MHGIVTIVQKPKRKGARAMLGFASTFRETRTTAEWMVDTCVTLDISDPPKERKPARRHRIVLERTRHHQPN